MSDKAISLFQSTLGLVRPFRLHIALSALLGICGGLSITALLATINTALNTEGGPDLRLALLFGGLCLLGVLCSTCSKLLTNYVGQRVVATLRQDLAARILVAPIEQIERYRIHRMIPVLLSDVATLSAFALTVAPMLIAFTVTLSCLTYLALLSWPILLITLVTVIIGTGAQYMAHSYGMRSLLDARDGEDDLQKHYQAITQGAKELRIQKERRLHIQNQDIHGTTQRICQANIRAATIFLSAETFGSMLFFAVIGIAIAFQVFWPSADKTVLSGFVLVMLYMKAPLEQLVTNVPGLSRAKVAFRRIHEMAERFSSAEPQLLAQTSTAPAEPLTAIELRQLTYTYAGNGFNLGPIDLTIRQGEITFIVGENGCGKTTLIKLLLGLYSPHEGEILWNGRPVRDLQRDAYRQLFATVFTDYYLFDQLLQGDAALPEEALKYLERLDIAHKVNIRDGQFSTTDLSTGQRKRLALVNAWLDNRPVLVFDEWAADQDPAFRRVFYTELLPELKRQGKTIVVISHDDRYFDVADQLVHLHAGQVVDEPESVLA